MTSTHFTPTPTITITLGHTAAKRKGRSVHLHVLGGDDGVTALSTDRGRCLGKRIISIGGCSNQPHLLFTDDVHVSLHTCAIVVFLPISGTAWLP